MQTDLAKLQDALRKGDVLAAAQALRFNPTPSAADLFSAAKIRALRDEDRRTP